MMRPLLYLLPILLSTLSCKKEVMDLSYTITGQVFDSNTEEAATGKTIFIFGYDGTVFGRDEIKFKETIFLGEEGEFEFAYSKLFTDKKAARSSQFILVTDIDMSLFRDFEREPVNILDSLEWNTNYEDLELFHPFN